MLLTENVLNVIRDIVVETVRARPQAKTVELTVELLKAFGVDVDHVGPMMPVPLIDPVPTAEYLTKEAVLRQAVERAANDRGEICKAIQPEILPAHVPMSAPFPPTADSGDSIYDPIAATSALPPLDDLLQSMWVTEHSARKIDNQTVVISSVHYADFLAMRDQLMAINELAKHGNVDFDLNQRSVTVTGPNSLKTLKAEPTETMTSAAQRLLGHIECETIF